MTVGAFANHVWMAHLGHDQRGSKQHAQLRGDRPRLRPYWVYDEEDWKFMRSLPTGSLICPEPGCDSQFQVPQENARGTRFLKNRPEQTCSHTPARPDLGGGPVSNQHRWLQARLARIVESLGMAAITEHAATNADVFVHGPDLAIEVQRWTTAFEKRTAARLRKGAGVLWLLTEDAKGRSADSALFRLPAVRVRVHDWDDVRQRLRPWQDRSDGRRARLSFYATVAKLRADDSLETGLYDARAFLAEVVEGRRKWWPPGTPGLPENRGGMWVLDHALDAAAKAAARRPQPLAPSADASHSDKARTTIQRAVLEEMARKEAMDITRVSRRRLRRRPPRLPG